MNAQEAQRKIRAILADKDHAYHDSRSPQHQDAVDVMQGLYEIVYPVSEPEPGGQRFAELAQSQIRKKESDPDFMAAYREPGHADHAQAVETMNRLYREAHPEPSIEEGFADAGGPEQ